MRYVIGIVAAVAVFAFGIWTGVRAVQELEKRGCRYNLADLGPTDIEPREPGVVRFAALGDQGTGDEAQAAVARTLADVCARLGCDFVLLLGDNVYPTGLHTADDPAFGARFERMYQDVPVPFYAVLGNHDVKSPAIYQVALSTQHPKWRMPNYRYTFHAGPARFVALNTNCGLLDWAWLSGQLGEAQDAWTFVFGHHPVHGTGPHKELDAIDTWVWERYSEPHVDFYLDGHNHVLEHLVVPGGRTEYIVSGGGAGPEYGDPRAKVPSTAESRFRWDSSGLVWFEARPDVVDVRFFNGEGERIHEFTRRRAAERAR